MISSFFFLLQSTIKLPMCFKSHYFYRTCVNTPLDSICWVSPSVNKYCYEPYHPGDVDGLQVRWLGYTQTPGVEPLSLLLKKNTDVIPVPSKAKDGRGNRACRVWVWKSKVIKRSESDSIQGKDTYFEREKEGARYSDSLKVIQQPPLTKIMAISQHQSPAHQQSFLSFVFLWQAEPTLFFIVPWIKCSETSRRWLYQPGGLARMLSEVQWYNPSQLQKLTLWPPSLPWDSASCQLRIVALLTTLPTCCDGNVETLPLEWACVNIFYCKFPFFWSLKSFRHRSKFAKVQTLKGSI